MRAASDDIVNDSITCQPVPCNEESIFNFPESEDDEEAKSQELFRRHLNFEEECKYAAALAFCSRYSQFAKIGFERKGLPRSGVKSAYYSLLRSIPNVAKPGRLPLLWSKMTITFVRATKLCKRVVEDIERATAMRLKKERVELKAMAAKLKEVGNDEALERSIAGKKRLIRGEARKVALLHELLEAQCGRRSVLTSAK